MDNTLQLQERDGNLSWKGKERKGSKASCRRAPMKHQAPRYKVFLIQNPGVPCTHLEDCRCFLHARNTDQERL